MLLSELPRNDPEAAMAYYREAHALPGGVSPEEAQMLLMLQDDPTELQKLFGKFLRSSGIE